MPGRRPSAAAVGALFLIMLAGGIFLLGRCAAAASTDPDLPRKARSWIVLVVVVLLGLLVWCVWRAIRRR